MLQRGARQQDSSLNPGFEHPSPPPPNVRLGSIAALQFILPPRLPLANYNPPSSRCRFRQPVCAFKQQRTSKMTNNQFSYLMSAKLQSRRSAYTWRPDWRNPPGVNQARVFGWVAFWLAVAAVPIYVLPRLRYTCFSNRPTAPCSRAHSAVCMLSEPTPACTSGQLCTCVVGV